MKRWEKVIDISQFLLAPSLYIRVALIPVMKYVFVSLNILGAYEVATCTYLSILRYKDELPHYLVFLRKSFPFVSTSKKKYSNACVFILRHTNILFILPKSCSEWVRDFNLYSKRKDLSPFSMVK